MHDTVQLSKNDSLIILWWCDLIRCCRRVTNIIYATHLWKQAINATIHWIICTTQVFVRTGHAGAMATLGLVEDDLFDMLDEFYHCYRHCCWQKRMTLIMHALEYMAASSNEVAHHGPLWHRKDPKLHALKTCLCTYDALTTVSLWEFLSLSLSSSNGTHYCCSWLQWLINDLLVP